MKKCLFVACVAPTIGSFNMNNVETLKNMGYEVEVACDFKDRSVWTDEKTEGFLARLKEESIAWHQIDFSRNMLKLNGHRRSYQQLLSLLKDGDYNFVHCHTPIAAAITRMAAKKTKTKVIYTAHGFHFFKGAPLKNWMLFYPVEKYFAPATDILITINQEDYTRAQKKLKAKNITYIPGVGVHSDGIEKLQIDVATKRADIGIPADAKLMISVGELNTNKNHETIIRALAKMQQKDVYYIICGKGNKKEELEALSTELGVNNRVKLLGYRTDIMELCISSDLFVFPSKREGLPVSLMEAMICGLPCVVSSIRGNSDLIIDGKGGRLVAPMDVDGFSREIDNVIKNKDLCDHMGEFNAERVKAFDFSKVNEKMRKIYQMME